MFENRLLRRIFGPKRDEVTEGCNKLYCNAYMLLLGKPEGKSPLGRPRCRWVDNIKMVLREI
jgi:hypothetical protein